MIPDFEMRIGKLNITIVSETDPIKSCHIHAVVSFQREPVARLSRSMVDALFRRKSECLYFGLLVHQSILDILISSEYLTIGARRIEKFFSNAKF